MTDETYDKLKSLTELGELNIPGSYEGEEPEAFEMPIIDPVVSNPEQRGMDVNADYTAVRDNAHFQQQLLKLAALKAFENASCSDAPRMMEVFSTIMSQLTNNNKQLLDIHKQMNEVTQTKSDTSGQTTIQTDNIFIGNTNDLLSSVGSRQEYLREKAINADYKEVQEES